MTARALLHTRRGFTLLELLVAITVLTGVVAMVYSGLSMVVGTVEAARESARVLRSRQIIERHVMTHLSTLHADASCEEPSFALIGEEDDGPFGPADSLIFCSSQPVSGLNAVPGIMKKIEYVVVDQWDQEGGLDLGRVEAYSADEEMLERLSLQITETPVALSSDTFELEEESETLARVFQVPIGTVEFWYYDMEEEDWVESWNSLDRGMLPWAVRVRINFARTEADREADYALGINPLEEPDLDLSIPLAMGAGTTAPFMDLNHYRSLGLTEEDADVQQQ